MLHAMLHHKLDETTLEPQRLEDALTSTVIGTLALVDAADVLADWFGRATPIDGSRGPVGDARIEGVWFWPQLALAEPDVILRLGDRVFVIEAKYRSDRHDAPESGDPGDDAIRDQLQRQWESLSDDRVAATALPDDLRSALYSCAPTLLFVVDRRRLRRAQGQFDESAKLLPEADIRLLTWQTLHEILAGGVRDRPTPRWSIAIRNYLEETGLGTFTGLRRCLPLRPLNTRALWQWRRGAPARTALDIRQALPDSTRDFAPLADWSVDQPAAKASASPKQQSRLRESMAAVARDAFGPARTFAIWPRGEG